MNIATRLRRAIGNVVSAPVLTLRGVVASATNHTSYAASLTIPANELAFMFVATESNTPVPTIVDSNRTWVLHETQAHPAFGFLYLFRSFSNVLTTGSAAVTFSATVANCTWICGSASNVNMSGTNGSGAIGQVTKTLGASLTPTVSFSSAFSNPTNPTVGGFYINDNFRTLSIGSGWNELSRIEETNEDVEILVEYKNLEDQTVEANIGASNANFAAIAFEIKAA